MMFTRLQKRLNGEEVSPFYRIATWRDELDNLFQQAAAQPLTTFDQGQFLEGGSPALDFYEDKGDLVVKIELPGMKKEDISISLEDGLLTVSGERKHDVKHDTATTCRCERMMGHFERRITLPCQVDAGKIKAAYTDGVLTITLPKAEEAKPKQIPITIA